MELCINLQNSIEAILYRAEYFFLCSFKKILRLKESEVVSFSVYLQNFGLCWMRIDQQFVY